ncbi:hypothetical protein [Flavobacterium sp.]|jgi:hypothetical protein|uniref:hypothetical protein n=1 Tax=Flavobacterium sp. TaxID=239 RepID=UPI0035AD92F0
MKKGFCFLLAVLFSSCQWFTSKENKNNSIARVGKNYLSKSDIQSIVPAGSSKEDSIIIIRSFIDKWATQKLLIDAAERNLNDKKKNELNALIKQYKIDLYTNAYIDEVVKQTVDTVVSIDELKEYYKLNKENFKTNGLLVKLRYINLPYNNPKLSTIRDKFFNFNQKDKKYLEANTLQYKNYALNDTVWVEMSQVYEKLPIITPDNRDEYILAGKKMQVRSQNDLYLIKISNVLNNNQIAPFDYIKTTLKEVIINKRKLELIKKFQKEITQDAIKNGEYEIYK